MGFPSGSWFHPLVRNPMGVSTSRSSHASGLSPTLRSTKARKAARCTLPYTHCSPGAPVLGWATA